MSVEQNKKTVTSFYSEVNDARRFDLLDEICTPDVKIHDPLTGDSAGIEAVKGVLAYFSQAFSSQKTELHWLVGEGNHVAVLHTHTGVNTGSFNGMPPTGRRIEVIGCELFRLQDGKIAELWRIDTDLSLMMQLGAIPALAAA